MNYSVWTVLVPIFFQFRRDSLSDSPAQPTGDASARANDATMPGNAAAGKGSDSAPQPTQGATPAPQESAEKVMTGESAGPKPKKDFHRYPFYSPRFWHGMRAMVWFRLLQQGRFRIHPTRIGILIGVTIATPVNTILGAIQKLFFRRKLAEADFPGPPVFIVGHWRSGTTLLHELMVRDERLSSPSTFQCFAPNHFLISEWFFRKFFSWLLPGKRPMDNMAAGWDRPQEDEFALLTLGMPSPYRRIAFPNEPPIDSNYLDFDGVDDEAIASWLETLRAFLISVSVRTGRPLVVKSPTHTGRIAQLAKEFPEAKFIHITRDPRSLFPSTCRLWHSLDDVQALQKPSGDNIEDYVIDCFERMYRSFHAHRDEIPAHRIIEVRYEDLTADPVQTMKTIYETLHLSDFGAVEETLQKWAETEHKGYKTNQHHLEPETEARIRQAWAEYFQRYGYDQS